MSKRKVKEVPLNTYDIRLHNEVFIPDVKVLFGGYHLTEIKKNGNELIEENSLIEVDEIVNVGASAVVVNNDDDNNDDVPVAAAAAAAGGGNNAPSSSSSVCSPSSP